jgi:hypothetical protein
MPRRKTHEEFLDEVNYLYGDEYTVLGTYETSGTKLEIQHNTDTCGLIFEKRPNDFLNGSCCTNCSKKRHIEFRQKWEALRKASQI